MYKKSEIKVYKNGVLENILKQNDENEIQKNIIYDFENLAIYKLCKVDFTYNKNGTKDLTFTYKTKDFITIKKYFDEI